LGFRFKISVVIPVYNCGEYLEACVASLKKQTMRSDDFQIIFINDGSSDNSNEICRALAEKNSNIVYFEKENGGVSSARNKGIELSEGKYILFLDADDTLTPDTLKKVYKFFEKNYDETDLVTYKIVPYRNGLPCKTHYRYNILKKSGIYDLNELEYCHIAQSTMNVCVKNLRENNPLFDTNLKIHEDQKYCFSVLKNKLTIGYVSGPEYHYLRHPGSAMGKSKAYYIFEDTMAMWEELFGQYKNDAPKYLQAFFLHDLNWKGTSDFLLPYHYQGEKFETAINRIKALINRIDDEVILSRPSMEVYHKHYLLRLKNSSVECRFEPENIVLSLRGEDIYTTKMITACATHIKVKNGIMKIDAFLKSPIFAYMDKPDFYLVANGERTPVETTHSIHEYYHSNIKNSVFWRFVTEIDLSKTNNFHFEIDLCGQTYPVNFYHMNHSPFTRGKTVRSYYNSGFRIKEKRGNFTICREKSFNGFFAMLESTVYNIFFYLKLNPRVLYNRLLGLSVKNNTDRIWIYLDRYGLFDNAYIQFKHDFGIADGVKRYYIINEEDLEKVPEMFTEEEQKHLVIFHSKLHKKLYFCCEKLITGFSNLSNVCPFGGAAMRWYADLTNYEIIYLQHGILHASLLKMYGSEYCACDKVVVSSHFEVENFKKNYGYSDEQLIKACMPRYDEMEISGKKKNRILFSPSWRSNLIGALINNEREATPAVFLESDFYKQVSAFLNSEKLHELLEKNDLYLDFQNHPIFKCYNHLFEINSNRISTEKNDTKQDEYRLMITDYSSIVFDSVYLNCPIIYFVPDYDLFLSGVSHTYRKLDLPLENGFGPFAHDADELIKYLEECIANGFVPEEPYASRMSDFFLYRDNHCCDRLYEAIK